jgi:hypothetical protein
MRWTEFLSEKNARALQAVAGGARSGIGQRPALLIIDAQNYMVGEPEAPDNLTRFPFSCGQDAAQRSARSRQLLDHFRASGWPVVFTRFVQLRGGAQDRALHRKLVAGTAKALMASISRERSGAEIRGALAPHPGRAGNRQARAQRLFRHRSACAPTDWNVRYLHRHRRFDLGLRPARRCATPNNSATECHSRRRGLRPLRHQPCGQPFRHASRAGRCDACAGPLVAVATLGATEFASEE